MEPKIRLKGYSKEWQQVRLGEIGSFKSAGVDKKINANESMINLLNYMDVYNKKDINASNCNELMHVSATSKQIQECNVLKGDIFFTPTSETAEDIGHVMTIEEDLPNTCYSYHLMRFRPQKDVFYGSFPNYGLESDYIRKQMVLAAKGVQRMVIGKSDFDALSVYLPTINEQKDISKFFNNLNALIKACNQKIESLKKLKIASLQSMIPVNEELLPLVRFGSFDKDWTRVKLGDILIERHEASTITSELPQLSFTIADGVIRPEDRKSNQRDFLIKDKYNKRYLVTRVGDIIYNPANVVYGAIHRNSLIDGVVSPIYRIFSTEQDSRFMECVVRRPSFISQLAMRTEGTVTKLKTLKPEAFLDMTVCIPTDLEEQKMIGEYFRNLDSQITLQTQRLEKLKQIKSACLDNMFV